MEPPRYWDKDGSPMTVFEWADKRDDPKYILTARDSITDRDSPFWTLFVTTGWLGYEPIPGQFHAGEFQPRVFRTEVIRIGHTDPPRPVFLPSEEHAWATEGDAEAGHHRIVQQLMRGFSAPVVSPALRPAAYAGVDCPQCGEKALREIARPEEVTWEKVIGEGTRTRVDDVRQWVNRPVCVCARCSYEKVEKLP